MSAERRYEVIEVEGGRPDQGVDARRAARGRGRAQLATSRACRSSTGWVAAMPDVHWGIGATVGSVIPTVGAIIPAAVGVDIGCGMMAVRTTPARRATCPTIFAALRTAIEAAVPHGRTTTAAATTAARGAHPPAPALAAWDAARSPAIDAIVDKHPKLARGERRHRTSARSAPATTSSRSASTRRTASGSCCTAARAASATGSARYFIELAKRGHAAASSANLPGRGPRLLPRRAPSTSTTTSRRSAGRRTSR